MHCFVYLKNKAKHGDVINVTLHIKYLEFLQKRFMTYSLLSKNVTNVNEVELERVTQLCFL